MSMSPESARKSMLQVAGLMRTIYEEDDAVALAIGVLLRPFFVDGIDEQSTISKLVASVHVGVSRAADMAGVAGPGELPDRFWDRLIETLQEFCEFRVRPEEWKHDPVTGIPLGRDGEPLWTEGEERQWNRLAAEEEE